MDLLLFPTGVVLLLLGGDSAIKGVSGLAQRLGLSPVAAGVLLLVFAGAMPELAVSILAMAQGQPDLLLGLAIGSTTVNLGLVLGVVAMSMPFVIGLRLAMGQLLLLVAAALALLLFARDGVLLAWEGGLLLLAYAAFLIWSLSRGNREDAAVQAGIAEFSDTRLGLALNLSRFVVAAAVLYFGARLMLQAAPVLGAMLGLDPLRTGMVPVAIGVGLPKLALVALAARNGQPDVVIGMVLGAGAFNLLFVLGGVALIQPLAMPAPLLRLGLPATLVFVAVLYPLLRGGSRLGKTQGRILLAIFGSWLAAELVLA